LIYLRKQKFKALKLRKNCAKLLFSSYQPVCSNSRKNENENTVGWIKLTQWVASKIRYTSVPYPCKR